MKTIYKIYVSLVAVLSLLCSGVALAAYPSATPTPLAAPEKTMGVYLGGQLGRGTIRTDNGHANDVFRDGSNVSSFIRTSDESGVTSRFFLGFAFFKFFGIEAGGSLYENGNMRVTSIPNVINGSGLIKVYSVDVMGKVSYHFHNKLVVFGKGGVAYVNMEKYLNFLSIHSPPVFRRFKKPQAGYVPKFEIGLGYQFLHNAQFFVAYSHTASRGNNLYTRSYLPALNQATVGIEYNFFDMA